MSFTHDSMLRGLIDPYDSRYSSQPGPRHELWQKTLVLKAAKDDSSDKDKNLSYLTRRFHKVIRRNRFLRMRDSSRDANANDLYHKCVKQENFIIYCIMHSIEYKYYTKTIGDIGNERTESHKNKK